MVGVSSPGAVEGGLRSFRLGARVELWRPRSRTEGEVVQELNFHCACGAMAWSVEESSPRLGIRYICHCDDCQAFARFTGRAEYVLDANGGTDAYQLPASRVRIIKGQEALACVRMTTRPLLRWHCASCRVPVANTYGTSALSFVSLPLAAASAEDREAILGPSSGHVWTKFGVGDLSQAKQVNIAAMLWRMACRIIIARLSGDYRNNPFFGRNDGNPLVEPRRLSQAERHDLYRRTGASG